MFKLVKYELRGNLFTIAGICITIIIANLLLLTRKASWGTNSVTGLSIFLAIGAIITIFIYSLTIMSKYLYEDYGYLLFTLPQSGISIILSRLITSLIQITMVVLVSFSCVYLIIGEKISPDFFKILNLNGLMLAQCIWGLISFLTYIYFCMIISKVAFRSKKIGKLGSFVAFILLSVLLGWISVKITELFPQTVELAGSPLNIAATLWDICTFTIFFISSSYLLDKKVDL